MPVGRVGLGRDAHPSAEVLPVGHREGGHPERLLRAAVDANPDGWSRQPTSVRTLARKKLTFPPRTLLTALTARSTDR